MDIRATMLSLFLAASLVAQEPSWLGTWKAGSPSDIAGAIERCTEEMSFIKRPIARSRLKKLNPAYQRIVIGRSGSDFTIQFDERQPIRMPADGKALPWTREDGEKFMVSVKAGAETLTQHYQGEDGERSNVFRIDAAGKALTLEVTVKSQKLPKVLAYKLLFFR